MPMPESITMTMRELDRFKVIQAVVEQGLPIWRAAEKLGLSRPHPRQLRRLWSDPGLREAARAPRH